MKVPIIKGEPNKTSLNVEQVGLFGKNVQNSNKDEYIFYLYGLEGEKEW